MILHLSIISLFFISFIDLFSQLLTLLISIVNTVLISKCVFYLDVTHFLYVWSTDELKRFWEVQIHIRRTDVGVFVKFKFLLCKLVRHLLINLKKLLKESVGPKGALEIMILLRVFISVTRESLIRFLWSERQCLSLLIRS